VAIHNPMTAEGHISGPHFLAPEADWRFAQDSLKDFSRYRAYD
jgi:hypothetical protein